MLLIETLANGYPSFARSGHGPEVSGLENNPRWFAGRHSESAPELPLAELADATLMPPELQPEPL